MRSLFGLYLILLSFSALAQTTASFYHGHSGLTGEVGKFASQSACGQAVCATTTRPIFDVIASNGYTVKCKSSPTSSSASSGSCGLSGTCSSNDPDLTPPSGYGEDDALCSDFCRYSCSAAGDGGATCLNMKPDGALCGMEGDSDDYGEGNNLNGSSDDSGGSGSGTGGGTTGDSGSGGSDGGSGGGGTDSGTGSGGGGGTGGGGSSDGSDGSGDGGSDGGSDGGGGSGSAGGGGSTIGHGGEPCDPTFQLCEEDSQTGGEGEGDSTSGGDGQGTGGEGDCDPEIESCDEGEGGGECDPTTEECGSSAGTCEEPPKCTDSPIQCALLNQSWYSRCGGEVKNQFVCTESFECKGDPLTCAQLMYKQEQFCQTQLTQAQIENPANLANYDPLVDSGLHYLGGDDVAGSVRDVGSAITGLDDSGFGLNRECLSDYTLSVLGASITIPFSSWCALLEIVGGVVLVLAGFLSGRIVLGAI